MCPHANTIRILAVDDHPQFRQGLAALLATQPDMKLVVEASNGREAIELYRTHCPDITLMDLQMPEMNGLDTMTAIRGEFPEARIIVLTTYSDDAQVVRAMQVGARAYLLNTLSGLFPAGVRSGASRPKRIYKMASSLAAA